MKRNASIPEGCRKVQSLPMSSNDLEAQRAVVLSFRIQVGGCCDFRSNRYSLRIQELHQLLTYGGMSKSGNKPTLQVTFKAISVKTRCELRSGPWRWLKTQGIQICQRKSKNSPDRSDSHYIYESRVLYLQGNMIYTGA